MGMLGFILVLLLVNGLVSFGLASFIHSTGLAIVASAVTTVMLFLLWGMHTVADARGEDVHDVFLAINILLMFVAPGAILTSFGFVLWVRHAQKKSAKSSQPPDKENGDPLPDRRL
jgi:hypothetical protein